MLSTPVRDAASISSTSRARPSLISVHAVHLLHGFAVGPVAQLSPLARMRATVVFPVPRTPAKTYAWAIRPPSSAFLSVLATCGWPTSSSSVRGRHVRASTWYIRHLEADGAQGILRRLRWSSYRCSL